MADHAGHAHARLGGAAGAVVVAAGPGRVAQDRLAGDRVPGHALRVQRGRAGDDHDRVDLVRVQHRPLQRLHAAERAARHRGQPLDAELVEEGALGPHHVGHGDHREVRPVGPAGGRVVRRGPGGAAAAAEQVGRDDVVAAGVEGLARPDHPVPPAEALARGAVAVGRGEAVAGALGRRRGGDPGRVGVAAERVADQDDVVPRGRQRAVGLVGHPDRVDLPAAVELDRGRQVEELGLNDTGRAGQRGRTGGERRGWLGHTGYVNAGFPVYCQQNQ